MPYGIEHACTYVHEQHTCMYVRHGVHLSHIGLASGWGTSNGHNHVGVSVVTLCYMRLEFVSCHHDTTTRWLVVGTARMWLRRSNDCCCGVLLADPHASWQCCLLCLMCHSWARIIRMAVELLCVQRLHRHAAAQLSTCKCCCWETIIQT
jgi:hypothetical protein